MTRKLKEYRMIISRILLLIIISTHCVNLLSAYSISDTTAILRNADRKGSDTSAYISPFREKNEQCFKCHGQNIYEFMDSSAGAEVKRVMFPDGIIDRNKFYRSNHKSFSCTDCHSENFTRYPHPAELKQEINFNCMDCHAGDEKSAKFKFENIDSVYGISVHYTLKDKGFTCWSCHNPHEYKTNINEARNLKEVIRYDNKICLDCHSDPKRFHLFSGRDQTNIMKVHSWLKDESAHLKNVRCLECHSAMKDSLLILHQILPKENAVRKCNECHSKNSLLMTSLYKSGKEVKYKNGFLNGKIIKESYVIGANRNEYLDILSLVIFALVSVIICIHIIFRVLKK